MHIGVLTAAADRGGVVCVGNDALEIRWAFRGAPSRRRQVSPDIDGVRFQFTTSD